MNQEIKEKYTYFCRGNGTDSHHVYLYHANSYTPDIVYAFGTYRCKLRNDAHGEEKSIFIFSKSNGIDRTSKNFHIAIMGFMLVSILAFIGVLVCIHIKYQPEFQKFYDNHVSYHAVADTTSTPDRPVLYNLDAPDNSGEVLQYFKDCEFTVVLCEDNQGGYLFIKCICLNRSKYSVNIVNLNLDTNIDGENLETQIKNLGEDYPAIVTLLENTFKMHFQHFALLKYDEFSHMFTENTMNFIPQDSFINAITKMNTAPDQMTTYEKTLAEYYLSNGFPTEHLAYSYENYVSEIMTAKEAFLTHMRTNGKYPQTIETSVYQMENDFLFAVLENIAQETNSGDFNSKCIETNLSWNSVTDLLMLATYKDKTLYHSYFEEENTVSIPYTSDCMWYEDDTEFNLYVSENYIDSLAIKWLYYEVRR